MQRVLVSVPALAECKSTLSDGGIRRVLEMAWATVLQQYRDTDSITVSHVTGDDSPVTTYEDLTYDADLSWTTTVKGILESYQYAHVLSRAPLDAALHRTRRVNSLLTLRLQEAISTSTDPSLMNETAPRPQADSVEVSMTPYELRCDASFSLDEISEISITGTVNSFNMSEIHSLSRGMSTILKSMYCTPELAIGRLLSASTLDIAEIRQSNAIPVKQSATLLHDMVSRSVKKMINAKAVISWDGELTYNELEELSDRLALHLTQLISKPNSIIPICFEKSVWAIVSMLAVLKAGCGYVCVDSSHPHERREFIVKACSAEFIVTSHERRDLFSGYKAVSVSRDLVSSLPRGRKRDLPVAKPEDICIVFFTSGSTGVPKGIKHTHASICTGLHSNIPDSGLEEVGLRVFQNTSYTFDVSILEIYGALVSGAVICIPSESERMNEVSDTMNRLRAEWAFCTPAYSRFLQCFELPTLKTLRIGGEAVTNDDIKQWAHRLRLVNLYGPTEASCCFSADLQAPSKNVSIGSARNVHIWVVHPIDPAILMPIGAVGELIIESPSVLKEYLNDPEKTEKVFLKTPEWRYANGPKQVWRMLKTGDLVRYLPDGTLTYLRRKDTMIKLRGQRMELGEVESVLRKQLPSATSSAVDVVNPSGRQEDAMLAAFVSPSSYDEQEFKTLREELKTKLREFLPEFMVPKVYLPVRSMPLTISRKLDRNKLKRLSSALTLEKSNASTLLDCVEPPQSCENTSLETTLTEICRVAFPDSRHSLSLDDDFVHLGGDSVIALRIIQSLRKQGLDLSIADVLNSSSLKDLAALVKSGSSQPAPYRPFELVQMDIRQKVIQEAAEQCKVTINEIEDVYPLSPMQSGMWTMSQVEEGKYVLKLNYKLRSGVTTRQFCDALRKVSLRNQIFRSRVVYVQSQVLQAVLRSSSHVHLFQNKEPHVDEDSLDVSFGKPLMQLSIADSHRVELTIHHVLADSYLFAILAQLTDEALRLEAAENVDKRPEFNRFIQYFQTMRIGDHSRPWADTFKNFTGTPFPTLPSPNYRPQPECYYYYDLSFVKLGDVKFTKAEILRVAWSLVLCHLTSSSDVAFSETTHGREGPFPEASSLVGPTFITTPFRATLHPSMSLQKLLESNRQRRLELIPHQYLSLGSIAAASSDCARACKLNNLLVIQHLPRSLIQHEYFAYEEITPTGKSNSTALLWECTMTDEGVKVESGFDEKVISQSEVRQIGSLFESLVKRIALGDLNMSAAQVLKDLDPDTGKKPSEEVPEKLSLTLEGESSDHTIGQQIRKAWGHVFETNESDLKADDDFFSLGGNSINVMSLVASVRRQEIPITVADVFRNPILQDLERVAQEKSGKPAPEKVKPHREKVDPLREEAAVQCKKEPDAIESVHPATPMQETLITSSQARPGAYVAQYIIRPRGCMNGAALKSIWNRLATECAILRTRIIRQDAKRTSHQVIVDNDFVWQEYEDREKYLDQDRNTPMTFGDPLCRLAICLSRTDGIEMVWTIHHSLYDGYTCHAIIEALNRIHEGHTIPQHPPFSAFANYVSSLDRQAVEQFWKRQCSDWTSNIWPSLPTVDYRPEASQNVQYSIQQRSKPSSMVSMANVARAAWALLISQYSDTQDVCFGSILSGRNAPVTGIENIIGPTVTTVPVRVRVPHDQNLKVWLRGVQDQALDMMPYEQTGIANIRKFGDQCSEVCNFQSMMVVQTPETYFGHLGQKEGEGSFHVEESAASTNHSYFNDHALLISVFLKEDGGINFVLNFDPGAISELQVQRLARQYDHLLTQLTGRLGDHSTVSNVLTTNGQDVDDILHWNRCVPPLVNSTIPDLIQPSFETYQDSVAIDAWDGRMSYRELDEKINLLSRYFLQQGLRTGDIVALCFAKGINAVVTILAVIKSGAAFCFVDPDHPPERHGAILSVLQPSHIAVSRQYMALFRRCRHGKLLAIDNELLKSIDAETLAYAPDVLDNAKPSGKDTVYIVTSSGTSGTPKAITHTHSSVSSSIVAHAPILGITNESRVVQHSPFTFDAIITEILHALYAGASICIPSDDERLNNPPGFIDRFSCTWAFYPPSFSRVLRGSSEAPNPVPSMKTIILGGEMTTTQDIENWSQLLQLKSAYGLTEAQGWCVSDLTAGECGPGECCPSGATASNVWVVDQEMRLLPVGAVGEIMLSSPSIAKEYLGDAEKTKAAFVEVPDWLPTEHKNAVSHLLRTRDAGRFTSEGKVQILGRIDSQVKINGQRMELGEIETHLQDAFPASKTVTVDLCTRKSDRRKQHLVAFVSQGDNIGGRDFAVLPWNESFHGEFKRAQERLRNKVPQFMVPKHFISVNRMPITVNGKLDRDRLQRVFHDISTSSLHRADLDMETDSDEERKLGEDEEVARRISVKLAELADVAEDDKATHIQGYDVLLKQAGIDSLATVSLAMFVNRTFRTKITTRQFNRHNVRVRDVARWVQETTKPATTPKQSLVGSTGRVGPLNTELSTLLSRSSRSTTSPGDQSQAPTSSPPTSVEQGSPRSRALTGPVMPTELSNHTTNPKHYVFLTGATGFLGIEILRQLLSSPTVSRVIALVRATDVKQARSRVLSAARAARWWSSALLDESKLELCYGDLSKPRFGLAETMWSRLKGRAGLQDGSRVTAVIHNGAVVHWDSSYESLKAANVTSTEQLLNLLKGQDCKIRNFTYVSGGTHLDITSSTSTELRARAEDFDGYSQSKLTSSLLVQTHAKKHKLGDQRVNVVTPGLIIGTRQEGVANLDDYVWRLVAGCVRLGGYNASESNRFLAVAGADQVAGVIIDACLGSSQPRRLHYNLNYDGVLVGEFWHAIAESLGAFAPRPMKLLRFVDGLREDVRKAGDKHPMWTAMHWLEETDACIGEEQQFQPERALLEKAAIVAAVKKSIEYLASVGYFDFGVSGQMAPNDSTSEAFFRRSSKVSLAQR